MDFRLLNQSKQGWQPHFTKGETEAERKRKGLLSSRPYSDNAQRPSLTLPKDSLFHVRGLGCLDISKSFWNSDSLGRYNLVCIYSAASVDPPGCGKGRGLWHRDSRGRIGLGRGEGCHHKLKCRQC